MGHTTENAPAKNWKISVSDLYSPIIKTARVAKNIRMRTIASIKHRNILQYLSLNIVKLCSWKTVPFLEEIMAMDKYHSSTKNTFPQKVIEGTNDP